MASKPLPCLYLSVSCLSQPGSAPYTGRSSRSKGKPEFTFSNPLYFELPFFGQAAERSTRKRTLMFHLIGHLQEPGGILAMQEHTALTPGQGSHRAARQRACPRHSTVTGARYPTAVAPTGQILLQTPDAVWGEHSPSPER